MRQFDPFFVLGPVLALVCFATDLSFELGVAGAVLYQSLILMCLPRGAARHLPYALITALGLTLLGWQLSPGGATETWKVIVNRVLSIFMISATALAIWLKHRSDARFEAELEARREAEREAAEQEELARLGEMASLVAHEVKNAMGGIRGAVHVLGRSFAEDSRELGIVERVNDRVDSLVRWVEQVLSYSRPFHMDRKVVQAGVLVDAAVRQFRDDPTLSREVTVDAPDTPLPIDGDPELLRRALLNLLMNAAQADQTGPIRVVVRPIGESWCEIVVEDRGPGIPLELRDKVLRPFFTTRTSGTGLGLPLVKKTARSHGGDLALDHPSEGGTVVRLRLPRLAG